MVLLLPLFAAKKMKDSVGESAKRFTYSNIEQSVTKGIQGLYSILHSNPLDKKLSELNSRLIADSNNLELICQRGVVYMMKGQFKEAESEFRSALNIQSDYYPAFCHLSTVLLYTGRDEVIDTQTKAIECFRDLSPATNGYDSGYSDMLHSFKQSLPDPFQLRGLREEKRQVEKQVRNVLSAKSIFPKHSALYNNRGSVHFRFNDFERAMKDFETALSLSADDPEGLALSHFNIGQVYYYRSDLNHALNSFTKCIETGYSDIAPRAYAMRSYAHFRLGNDESGLKDRRIALDLDPSTSVDQFHYQLLSEDALLHVLSFLPIKDLCSVSATDTQLRTVCLTPYLWPLQFSKWGRQYFGSSSSEPRETGAKETLILAGENWPSSKYTEVMEQHAANIKTIVFQYPFNRNVMNPYLNQCVNLESLRCRIQSWESVPDLTNLKKLRKLDLERSSFLEFNVVLETLLGVVGSQLTSLNINKCVMKGDATLNAKMIETLCPNLRRIYVNSNLSQSFTTIPIVNCENRM